MFAVAFIPQFALQSVLRHEPAQWAMAVALVDPAMSTPRVAECTAAAADAGVEIGLTPTQALARCREIRVRHRSTAQEREATDAMLQAAYAFSPNLEVAAPGLITLDLRGLVAWRESSLADREHWCRRLVEALLAIGLRAQVGAGATPNIARHAARWSSGGEIVSDPRSFIAALPLAALEPSSDVAELLSKWGIRNVGELLALGQDALAERIGLEALALFAAASVDAMRPLRLSTPPESYTESIELDEPMEMMEPLLFLLRRFVDSLARRLEPSGLAAAELVLHLRLESAAGLDRRLRVPEPTRDAGVLFRMLHTHLESLRTDSPIVEVGLEILPARPEQRQFSLFEAALRDPHQFQETLARLSALVGADRVGTPVRGNSHRADDFTLVPPDFENAPGSRSKAPWLLRPVPVRKVRPAQQATVATGTTAEGTRPISLHSTIAKGRIRIALGPVRTSGDWWEQGWTREEWDVQTHTGKSIRLVRTDGRWCVEGVLD